MYINAVGSDQQMRPGGREQPEVVQFIKAHFILVSLYVDDRKKLPASLYYKDVGEEKEIQTHGERWAAFEALNFGQVTQPMYAVVSEQQVLLNSPAGYMPDAKDNLTGCNGQPVLMRG